MEVYFAQVLLPALTPGSVIVLDNASFQHSPTTLKLVEAAGCHLLFLPAYSSDLNPIQHFLVTLKTRLRNDLPTATNPFLFIADMCLYYC